MVFPSLCLLTPTSRYVYVYTEYVIGKMNERTTVPTSLSFSSDVHRHLSPHLGTMPGVFLGDGWVCPTCLYPH